MHRPEAASYKLCLNGILASMSYLSITQWFPKRVWSGAPGAELRVKTRNEKLKHLTAGLFMYGIALTAFKTYLVMSL